MSKKISRAAVRNLLLRCPPDGYVVRSDIHAPHGFWDGNGGFSTDPKRAVIVPTKADAFAARNRLAQAFEARIRAGIKDPAQAPHHAEMRRQLKNRVFETGLWIETVHVTDRFLRRGPTF